MLNAVKVLIRIVGSTSLNPNGLWICNNKELDNKKHVASLFNFQSFE